MTRDEARLHLGAAAVLSVAAAVQLLPVGDAKARNWLRSEGLIHNHPELGRFVIWGEVLDALGSAPKASRPQPAPAARANLPRVPCRGGTK